MNIYRDGKKWRFDKRINGKRLQARGFKTREEARKALQEALQKQKIPTDFFRLCNEYLNFSKAHHTQATYKQKRYVISNLFKFTKGKFPTPLNIEEYLRSRPRSMWNYDFKEIKAMFRWAIRYDFTKKDPTIHVERMPKERKPKYIPPLEDIYKLLMVAGEYRDLLETVICCLGRRSEIFRLTWEDVNFEQGWIRLWTRKRRGGDYEYDELPLSDHLRKILERRWKSRDKSSPYIFVNPKTGTRYTGLNKLMRRLCQKAGIRPFGFHALRHFGASILADKYKEPTGKIQKLLRHKDRRTTEIYLHNLDRDLKDSLDKLAGEIDSKFGSKFGSKNEAKIDQFTTKGTTKR